jgi:hypothetical protein
MPPSLSLREGIFVNLKATLETITIANGYATALGTVTRGMLAPLETSVLPTASLLPVSDEPVYGPGVLRRELTVTVRVWIDVALADTPTALESLIADVQQALQVDPRRGALAENTLDGTLQYIYLQSVETLAGADISFQVDYRTQLLTPRVGV